MSRQSLLLALLAWALIAFMVLSLTSVGQQASVSNAPKGAVVVLMYHHVDDHAHSPNVVSPSALESHILAVLDAGYDIMSLAELSQWLDRPDLEVSGVVFTFDDGYESFYHYAFPLLKKYGVPASCFPIVSSSEAALGSVSASANMYPHLTFQQMNEMVNTGVVELGSHSYDGHKYAPTQKGSRPSLVEPLVNEDNAAFVNTRHGAMTANVDRYALPRIAVRPEMTGADVVNMVASAMLEAIGEDSTDGM